MPHTKQTKGPVSQDGYIRANTGNQNEENRHAPKQQLHNSKYVCWPTTTTKVAAATTPNNSVDPMRATPDSRDLRPCLACVWAAGSLSRTIGISTDRDDTSDLCKKVHGHLIRRQAVFPGDGGGKTIAIVLFICSSYLHQLSPNRSAGHWTRSLNVCLIRTRVRESESAGS